MGTGSSGKGTSGKSGSEPAMIRITYKDVGGSTEYRPASRGKILVDRGVSLAGNRTELVDTQFTLSQIAERARAAGAVVEVFNKKQTRQIDLERAKAERERPDYEAGTGSPDNRRQRRWAREARRGRKRAR